MIWEFKQNDLEPDSFTVLHFAGIIKMHFSCLNEKQNFIDFRVTRDKEFSFLLLILRGLTEFLKRRMNKFVYNSIYILGKIPGILMVVFMQTFVDW